MNYDEYYNEFYLWIREKIEYFAEMHKTSEYKENSLYIKDSALFITFNYDNSKIGNDILSDGKLNIGEIQFNQLHHFYNLVCREIFGRKYNEVPLDQRPMCFASLDVNGTKYWNTMGEINNIHIHTVWMIHPDHIIHLKTVINNIMEYDKLYFKQIHIENLDNKDNLDMNLRNIIMYSLKFDRFNIHEANIEDNFRLYPDGLESNSYKLKNW